MTNKVKRLTESAMLLAVAIVLEFLSKLLIPEMPFGGQVTLCSMLPVILIAYRHGMKWGFCAAFAYALLQMLMGAKTVAAAFQPDAFGAGVMLGRALLMCLLDYVVAFTALGLGGMFRSREKGGLALGTVLAVSVRFLTHVVSGCILYSAWAAWFFTQEGFPAWGAELVQRLDPTTLGLVYSLVYNAMYMLPELMVTTLAAMLLARTKIIHRM